MPYEVELRGFISDEDYEKLSRMFPFSEQVEITIYYSSPVPGKDLRLRLIEGKCTKIILKTGAIHDQVKKEIEVVLPEECFEAVRQLLKELAGEEIACWIRIRKKTKQDNVTVCLDDTVGYGKILELEMLAENPEEAKKKLEEFLKQLNVELKPISDEYYKEYLKSWRDRIKDHPYSKKYKLV
ncbi:MAG: CYTH domain-containing protein [bacterium]|nr:CYTH domain-containing protein [bacterium]